MVYALSEGSLKREMYVDIYLIIHLFIHLIIYLFIHSFIYLFKSASSKI